jgi:hypothetical protein
MGLWLGWDPNKGDYISPDTFKIGSIVLPYYKGGLPLEVIGYDGAFVKCKSLHSGVETLLFPSEIGQVLEVETRDNLINKIIS